ncbi:McrC family protein [Aldersonia sp. NBC_00410]|uniref:McrC family protein n=1 Tax=Aldersonia sp. NBC_00410 TaxID=2975954 RepID=UPI00225A272F|nr:hypothetical protein [Aldersonia sp. NBC_00410]MCX5042427.1 McrC family protein [Aldersonia sp. NBC_00410]
MIELAEHCTETCSLAPISVEGQERMTSVLGNRLSVGWLSTDRVQIRSSSWVGSVNLTPELRVRVVPKLAGNDLGVLTMLAITDGSPLQDLPRYFRGLSDNPAEDAIELLCRLVVTHTEDVVVRGLIRDYRHHSADLPFLRGRLDVYRQATVYHGQFTSLACTFDEFDRDTVENHLLLAGVRAARRGTTDAHIRRRAADLEAQLAVTAPTIPTVRKLLTTPVVYGRRNAHYRVAHTWCRSLLRLGRVDDTTPSDRPQIESFLINMNALFERFVEWLMARVFDGTGLDLRAQQRNPSLITVDGLSRRSIAPDLVVRDGNQQAAIDAKYKRYDEWEISQSDIYQLLLYAQCYTGWTVLPTSYLVYPLATTHPTTSTVELTVPAAPTNRKVRIKAIGIPLANIVAGLRVGNLDQLSATTNYMSSALPSPHRARVPVMGDP